jgi:3-oxoacyl-[acyl-carrier-protein] synthase II
MLSGKASDTTWCALHDMQFVYNPVDIAEVKTSIASFLKKNSISIQDIDLWIDGASGDIEHDRMMNDLAASTFKDIFHTRFKHLCGESCTASSFALWLGASILRHQQVPAAIKVHTEKHPAQLNTILIVNQYMNKNFSFFLLKQV